MSVGLYSGTSGLALGVGLWSGVPGFWSGAAGLIDGLGAALDLNFLAGAPLDSRITFTRSTTATRVNASGLIESVAIDGPRFDYDPVTLAPKGLLIEEQRTNLLTYSEQLDNAAWTKDNATVTANATTAPDGTSSADKLTETATSGAHRAWRAPTTTAAAHTFTVYLKAAERSFALLYAGVTNVGIMFNLSTGATTAVAGMTAPTASSATAVGNGWYRCSMTFTATAAANSVFVYAATDAATYSYAGTAGSGLFIWGAQLEAGAFATSYIPTVASQVTRTADVATMTGTNFSSWYNANAGTFVFNGDSSTISGVNFILTASDGTNNNRFGFYRSGAILGGYVTTATVTQMDITASSVVVNVPFKSAVAATLNDGNFSFNGGIGTTDTSISMPSPNQLGIGNANGSGFLNGHIQSIRYYPTRLTNQQLQVLST